jgi:O-antigen ligase
LSPAAAAGPGGRFTCVLLLLLLGLAPLLAGAVHEPVFGPRLAGCALAGLQAGWRHARRSAPGESDPPLPGARLLLAAHGLVLLQLVPLPPWLLRLVSPGSYAFYDRLALPPPLAVWRPISVSPPDTLRGLAFLAAFSLLFLAAFRRLAVPPWRRRLVVTIVATGVVLTVEAFVQSASSDPRRLWGVYHPNWDWGVFGAYVNRNHFAGYLVMAAGLALGLALEAFARLRSAWGRRRKGYLALGDREGNAAIRSGAVVMLLVAGLVASNSRGGISALAASCLLLPLAARKRRGTALAVAALVALGVAWIGLGGYLEGMRTRGVRASRIDLWVDMARMAPDFPAFGVGWNAFSTAYPWYQTVWRTDWIGEAHNDYLQVLLDAGALGALLQIALLATLFSRAIRRARRDPVDLGILGALVGLALHDLVDFNWQIPANAATWVALAGLACRPVDQGVASGRSGQGSLEALTRAQ